MTIEEILEKLKYNKDGVFHREALVEAVENRDLIIPELLKLIEFSEKNIESLNEEEYTYFAHIYAMFLLAYFREKRAYPLLIKFFSIPGEITLDFTGDVVTMDLCRILASVYDGDINSLKALIENEEANEYVRTAALETLSSLVIIGEASREEIINYFKELFNGKLEREFSNVWNGLVDESTKLYPEEVYEEIKTAFDDDLVDSFFIPIEEVQDALKRGKEQVLTSLKKNRRYRLVDDIISEFESWACFKQPKRDEKKQSSHTISDGTPFVRETEKIGRNAPCPCGSGKKYKKCCLNKET